MFQPTNFGLPFLTGPFFDDDDDSTPIDSTDGLAICAHITVRVRTATVTVKECEYAN